MTDRPRAVLWDVYHDPGSAKRDKNAKPSLPETNSQYANRVPTQSDPHDR